MSLIKIMCVIALTILTSYVVEAGTFRQGCKALLMSSGESPEFSFLQNLVEMKRSLIQKGCQESDIRIATDSAFKDADYTSFRKKYGSKYVDDVLNEIKASKGKKYDNNFQGVKSALVDLNNDVKANDRVFVMIAGHGGYAIGDEDKSPGAHFKDGFFLKPEHLKSYLKKMDEKFPGHPPVKQVVADFCWGGKFVKQLTSKDHNICVISSQNANEYSQYSETGGNSFSYWLAQKMKTSEDLLSASRQANVMDMPGNYMQSSDNLGSVESGDSKFYAAEITKQIFSQPGDIEEKFCGGKTVLKSCEKKYRWNLYGAISCHTQFEKLKSLNSELMSAEAEVKKDREKVIGIYNSYGKKDMDELWDLDDKKERKVTGPYSAATKKFSDSKNKLAAIRGKLDQWYQSTKLGQEILKKQPSYELAEGGKRCLEEKF